MTRLAVLATAVALASISAPASAQEEDEVVEQGSDRFFFDPIESEEELEETAYDGSITSTSFFFRESAGAGTPVVMGGDPPASASPLDRYFSDLRLRLDAEHIKGGKWDFRGDVRGRYAPECEERAQINGLPLACISVQSGTFGGTELDAREFYLLRRGEMNDISVGRQYVLELAAVQFDGVKVERRTTGHFRYIGFAGLYPARSSRDLRDDYPTTTPLDPAVTPEKRILPVVAGAGAAYRFEQAYGSVGVVGILPLADDDAVGRAETTRVFATAQGYYQRSAKLDLYHYLVLDGTGAGGAGLTNLSLGVNFRPKTTVRLFGQVNRVDTETLNVIAQERLEEPNPTDPGPSGVVQNDIAVTRIAHESARAGLNVDLRRNRFAVGVSGGFRRRPDVPVELVNGDVFVFPKAQAVDLTLHAVDRRSYKDFRFGLNVTRSFGVGEDNVDKATALIVRGDARRELWDGKGELEANLHVIDSSDDNRDVACPSGTIDPLLCFGTSHSLIVGAGAVMFYRPKPKWYVLGSLNAARQSLTTVSAGAEVPQPAILMLSAMARVAYRF